MANEINNCPGCGSRKESMYVWRCRNCGVQQYEVCAQTKHTVSVAAAEESCKNFGKYLSYIIGLSKLR